MLKLLTAEAGAGDGLRVTFRVFEVPVREDSFVGVSDHKHPSAIKMIHMTSPPRYVIILTRIKSARFSQLTIH